MRAFSPVARRMPSRRKGLKPASSTSRRYSPGARLGDRVHAIAGGDNHPLQIRPCFGDGDRRAGNGGSSLILHKAGDFAGSRLRTGGHATHTAAPDDREHASSHDIDRTSDTRRLIRSIWSTRLTLRPDRSTPTPKVGTTYASDVDKVGTTRDLQRPEGRHYERGLCGRPEGRHYVRLLSTTCRSADL